jgi:competence protein ComEC
MGIVHFLNVKSGDCAVIQHATGRISVIDVCNAHEERNALRARGLLTADAAGRGHFNQKDYPVNPISYLQSHGMIDVFRFILTHADMDHMDGLKAFCTAFPPTNFWDTTNEKEIDFRPGSPYNEADWRYYKCIRDGKLTNGPKRLVLYAGASGQYYNQGEAADQSGDGLHILAPTRKLMRGANSSDDFNDGCYVILYRSAGGRVLFAGDSHDETWDHILANHADDVQNVDLLIAPHHGRKSGRSYEFLDIVNPALTLFGNANSEHLAYGAWNYRGLPVITNNQAGCVVVDTNANPMAVYVTNLAFAQAWAQELNTTTYYSERHKAYSIGVIKARAQSPRKTALLG